MNKELIRMMIRMIIDRVEDRRYVSTFLFIYKLILGTSARKRRQSLQQFKSAAGKATKATLIEKWVDLKLWEIKQYWTLHENDRKHCVFKPIDNRIMSTTLAGM
jgi:hypothetical protein